MAAGIATLRLIDADATLFERLEVLARLLCEGLHEVFLKLPDEVQVHAAHGAGSPCGANISDRLTTTIGYERRFNPALQIEDVDRFVEYVLSTAPPEHQLSIT